MTVSNEPTTPRQYQPGGPIHAPEQIVPVAPAKRGPLRTTRDVLACIRDVLLIIVLAAMLIFGGAVAKGLSDVGNELNNPDPASTCIGEEPC